ncbi:hypothetical protein [Kribbella sp. CA-293567]|uniref:hypothetical protein n=1 Tax=Kribbella sp. CA-293567 TaxID=3002436 RepID=UPI0022DE04BF|nr:hypothetical protein [Kribbella sp. CA-293567]WBQ03826.1 hypothetical protein OX958_28130 [Kribbella sp. CA-293567]
MTRTANRHRCIHGVTPRCTRGNGKPKRQKCAECGGALLVESGVFGVFDHRGDGRYRLADAHATYAMEAAATREAAKDMRRVVRFITA